MPESTQKWSLSSRLNIIIAGIVALAMLLFSAVAILLVSDSERRNLVKQAEALAQQLAVQAGNTDLTREQTDIFFRGLAAHDFLEHVHLYTLSANAEPQLSKSYTAVGRSALTQQGERIENLPEFQFTPDYLEIVQPIFNNRRLNTNQPSNGDVVGYIYLRASLKQVQSAHRRQIFTSIIAFIAVMLSVSLSVRFFARTMESTLERFSRTIAKASQDHSFNIDEERDFPEEFADVKLQIKRVLEKYRHEKRYAEHSAWQAQRANEELEAEVADRTESLSTLNRKLTSALEALHSHQKQQLERDKMASLGDLIAGIAHELNSPIGASITATSFVQKQQQTIQQALSEKAITESQLNEYLQQEQQSFDTIMRNLSKCSDLIRHFQEIAMLNRNDKPKAVALSALIQRLNDTVTQERGLPEHVQFNIRNVTKHAHSDAHGTAQVSDDIVTIRVLALEQVLLEIIDNAIVHAGYKDASGAYQPLIIEVSLAVENDFLHVNVADNGLGIEPEMKAKIFQPFITSKRNEGGTGLGLYQVYNWVSQLLNGDIECQSIPFISADESPEHGTRFMIKIPTLNK